MANNYTTNHLAAAIIARKYVESKIDIGASNKVGTGMITRLLCAGGTFSKGEMRQKVEDDLNTWSKNNQASFGMKHYLDASADWSKHYGCGNCGEQSALAFVYLRQQGVKPLDWYQVNSFQHAFVIVDRASGSDPKNYLTWGNDAVVCDPWRKVVAYVNDESSYFSKNSPNLLYREE